MTKPIPKQMCKLAIIVPSNDEKIIYKYPQVVAAVSVKFKLTSMIIWSKICFVRVYMHGATVILCNFKFNIIYFEYFIFPMFCIYQCRRSRDGQAGINNYLCSRSPWFQIVPGFDWYKFLYFTPTTYFFFVAQFFVFIDVNVSYTNNTVLPREICWTCMPRRMAPQVEV